MFERRKRFAATMKVRERLQAEHGLWSPSIPESQIAQRATHLTVECGDILLELILTTVGDSRSADAKRLAASLKDQQAVERTWAFLTYAMAEWVRHELDDEPGGVGEQLADAVHALLSPIFPLDADSAKTLEAGPKAEALGYWSIEWLYTQHALYLLIGEDVGDLRFFADLEPITDLTALRLTWQHGEQRFAAVVDEGVLTPHS